MYASGKLAWWGYNDMVQLVKDTSAVGTSAIKVGYPST
jgi:hypothetical protein